jgi:RNA polymerase sigma-70 factor, ECF subfamily
MTDLVSQPHLSEPLPAEAHSSEPHLATRLLRGWRSGDSAARDQLVALLYGELHRLAARQLANERRGHTLQPTALVHEAYLRLIDQGNLAWQNRLHFVAIAALTMRRILVSHARQRKADKRGGGAFRVTLTEGFAAAERDADVLALHDALERLAALDRRQCRVVELRYFGGLTIEETAAYLKISPATVKVDWALARAWLLRELSAA